MHLAFFILGAIVSSRAVARDYCTDAHLVSCSPEPANRDSCCAPASRLELSRAWDEQRNRWVLEGIRVVSCDSRVEEISCDSSRVYPQSEIHNLVEGYARHAVPLTEVSRSLGWGGIGPNASDDEVTAVWAQQWARHGTCISTFDLTCVDVITPPGEEDAWNDPGPARFVKAMHQLQEGLFDIPKPLVGEPHQIYQEISLAGTPLLGTFQSEPNFIQAPVVQRLSFFANRELERAAHHEKDFAGFHHEEL